MPTTKQIIYVYRTGKAHEGGLLTVATIPCDGMISAYLPANSPVLKQLARNKLRDRTGNDNLKRTLLHAELAQSPTTGITATLPSIKTLLTGKGFKTKRNPNGGGGDTYDENCRLADIADAIMETKESRMTLRSNNAEKTHRKPRKQSGRPGHPAADALDWKEAVSTIERLEEDGRWRDALLVGTGCYLGLRISDILKIRWGDLTGSDIFSIEEKKTGKTRSLKLNPALRRLAEKAREELSIDDPTRLVFESWAKDEGQPISRQRAGQILKEIKEQYGLSSAKVFSTHSLRKTFGRRVWLQQCRKGRGEQALLLLCDVFGHSSIQITKRYLGIRQEEILSVYDNL